jgi:hypothetical protein
MALTRSLNRIVLWNVRPVWSIGQVLHFNLYMPVYCNCQCCVVVGVNGV